MRDWILDGVERLKLLNAEWERRKAVLAAEERWIACDSVYRKALGEGRCLSDFQMLEYRDRLLKRRATLIEEDGETALTHWHRMHEPGWKRPMPIGWYADLAGVWEHSCHELARQKFFDWHRCQKENGSRPFT